MIRPGVLGLVKALVTRFTGSVLHLKVLLMRKDDTADRWNNCFRAVRIRVAVAAFLV
jgi:hypothetical protein